MYKEIMLLTYEKLCMEYGSLIESQPLHLLSATTLQRNLSRLKDEMSDFQNEPTLKLSLRAIEYIASFDNLIQVKSFQLKPIQVLMLVYYALHDEARLNVDLEVALCSFFSSLSELGEILPEASVEALGIAPPPSLYKLALHNWYQRLLSFHISCELESMVLVYQTEMFKQIFSEVLENYLRACARPDSFLGLRAFFYLNTVLYSEGIMPIWRFIKPQIEAKFSKDSQGVIEPIDLKILTKMALNQPLPDLSYLKNEVQQSNAYRRFLNINFHFFKVNKVALIEHNDQIDRHLCEKM